MVITHIFFDLHGTLIDGQRMLQHYRRGVGQIMAGRYGKTPALWEEADRRIVADWDSYFADLNLSGDDMMGDLREGWLRVTRALFRLTATPEPPISEIAALAMELPTSAPAYGDALYEDARQVITHLHQQGYQLGIVTHALEGQANAALQGARMLDYFAAPIVGADTVEQFDKDRLFFLKAAHLAQVNPARCLVVDDSPQAIAGAKLAGMVTAYLQHGDISGDCVTDFHLVGDLCGLLILEVLRGE